MRKRLFASTALAVLMGGAAWTHHNTDEQINDKPPALESHGD